MADDLAKLLEKAKAGTITPEEQKKLNDAIAKKNEQIAPIVPPKPTAPNITKPAQAVPVAPPPPPAMDDAKRLELYGKQREGTATEAEKAELAADVDKRKARFSELEAKRQKGTWTPAEQKEYGALLQSATAPIKAGTDFPLPTKEQAQAAIDKAKAEGAIGYMDPAASTESLAAGGGPVYRGFDETPVPAAPTLEDVVASEEAKPKPSAVAKMIADMKGELGRDEKANFFDYLQAALAGYNFQTPAYLERKKAREAKASDIEKLEKQAEIEQALGEEEASRKKSENIQLAELQHAMEMEKLDAELRLKGLPGLGASQGMSKGQALGAQFSQGLGK